MRRPKNPDAWRGAHPFGRGVPSRFVKELAAQPSLFDEPKVKAALSEPLFPTLTADTSSRVTSLDEFAARAPKKKKGLRSAARSEVDDSLEEADRMREGNDFTKARPRHFVALYALFHKHVYGVHSGELIGKTWTAACLMAARILDREFAGDVDRFVSFIAWSWRREKRAHARSDGDRRRMGWRLQFSPALVTDYRVQLAKEQEGRRTG